MRKFSRWAFALILSSFSLLFSDCDSYSCVDDSCCEEDYVNVYSTYLTIKHVDCGGLGYNRGFSSIEAFLYPFGNWCVSPFIDLRVHKFKSCDGCSCKNSDWAANAGLGFRFVDCCQNIFGINAYYDYRSDCSNFEQIGGGIEILRECFDLRINGYFPLKERTFIRRCIFDKYVGNFFMIKDKYNTAFTGGDLELGFPFCFNSCLSFYAGLGPYYYKGKTCDSHESFWGGRARFSATVCCYLELEGMVTYDDRYKTKAQGIISFTLPLGCCSQVSSCRNTSCFERIRRNEIIVLDEFCKWKKNF